MKLITKIFNPSHLLVDAYETGCASDAFLLDEFYYTFCFHFLCCVQQLFRNDLFAFL